MTFLLPLLTRWKLGLGIFGALAFLGLALAANHYRHAYHAEKALREADRASYRQAQAEALNKALADAKARQDAITAHTIQIEDERNDLQDRFADLAARYRAANRVRIAAAQGTSGVLPAAAEDHSAGLRAPASETADMVAITGDDFDRCTVIAGDYVKLREWALGL